MISEAIILAGGFGTRLQTVISEIPKPLAPINNKPFLNYLFYQLKNAGIKNVTLSVGYLSNKIIEKYQNNFEGIKINYAIEKEALGTGGGIKLALEKCKQDEVFVLNGDSFFNLPFLKFFTMHTQKKSTCSLSLRKVEDAGRYGAVEINKSNRIINFSEKNPDFKAGNINAGIYILNKNHFIKNTPDGNFSLEKDYLQKYFVSEEFYGFPYNNYFIDIGIPDSFKQANNDFKDFENLP